MRKKLRTVAVIIIITIAIGNVWAGGGQEATADGKTEIRWMQWKTTEVGQEVMDELKAEFEKANPDFTLTLVDHPFNGFHDKVVTLAQAQQLPEVILVQVDWVGEFAQSKIITTLDPLVAEEPANFLDQYYDAFKMQVEGKRYSLPLHAGCVALYYNTDIFAREGISQPPKSWAELTEIAKKVTKPEKNQYAFTGTLATEPPTNMTYDIYPLMFQAGAKIVDENNKPVFNSDAGVKALEFYKELMVESETSVPGILQNGEKEKRGNFAAGNIAMMFEGPWGVAIQKNLNPDKDFGITTLPWGETNGTIVRGSLFAIPSSTAKDEKKLEGAWELVKFISGPIGGEIWCRATGDLPGNKIVADKPFVKENKYMKVFIEQMGLPNAMAIPHLPYQVELNRIMTIEVQNFVDGKKSAKQALDDAAIKWEELISK
ncbi:ABC transporter substrate-binding protein [Marispirochaeta aestuarii]|nr:ABC transporter substrate-binding protein [Marispirochaeta aestuarii]